ncbi:Protein MGR2 [Colletotrichum gloeosporioides]|uniref:Protein MGR2 n=1 Tax=Colletotrichum gloeosporioides TaxID=474922 RepID=A0A8H4CNU9_COLGL|nr:Protein MGR2 [Colletotrichum gloeosporioides]KAF3807360.1 Protein MGR2 [Colletotrichum gloeosporioides]
MPPVPQQHAGAMGPSIADKLKMGALMGGTVGAVMGFVFGSINIMRYGAGPNGIMRTLGQYMAGSGATFGYAQPYRPLRQELTGPSFFMSIGSVIRSDSAIAEAAYRNMQRRPVLVYGPGSDFSKRQQ